MQRRSDKIMMRRRYSISSQFSWGYTHWRPINSVIPFNGPVSISWARRSRIVAVVIGWCNRSWSSCIGFGSFVHGIDDAQFVIDWYSGFCILGISCILVVAEAHVGHSIVKFMGYSDGKFSKLLVLPVNCFFHRFVASFWMDSTDTKNLIAVWSLCRNFTRRSRILLSMSARFYVSWTGWRRRTPGTAAASAYPLRRYALVATWIFISENAKEFLNELFEIKNKFIEKGHNGIFQGILYQASKFIFRNTRKWKS